MVSCLMGDSTALASAIVRCCLKKETGTTVYHYVLLKRLNLARVLLAQGCRVDETCAGAGFNDYSNFIRTFKKHTGMTPAAFARASQSGRGGS